MDCITKIFSDKIIFISEYSLSMFTPTRSTLFINMIVGICSRCSVLNSNFVCACIPSFADITSIAPSSILKVRSTSAIKSMCPGVSMILIFVLSQITDVVEALTVIPLRFSISIESVIVLPSSTLPHSSVAPLKKSKFSVMEVFPASICARIPILIIFI